LDDEFERLWPEAFMLHFKGLFQKMHIEIEENPVQGRSFCGT
jgi:hypothetical protein